MSNSQNFCRTQYLLITASRRNEMNKKMIKVTVSLIICITLFITSHDASLASPDESLPAMPQNLQIAQVSGAQVDIVWDASNPDVAGYTIYRNGNKIGTSAATHYSDLTAEPATEYSYTVSAYNASLQESAQSSALKITTGQVYYISPTGDDSSGDGSVRNPLYYNQDYYSINYDSSKEQRFSNVV